MSADAVDFRFNILHGKLVFRHQDYFVLKTMKKHTNEEIGQSIED